MSLEEEVVGMAGQKVPLIWKQFSQPGDWVAHNPREDVVKVLPRVDAAGFARLNQPELKSGCTGTAIAGSKQPILPSQCQGPDSILGEVVVRPEATVFEVTIK